MKHRLFPLFLTLLLTGCSTQTDTSAPESPTETMADSSDDSLAESPTETEPTALPPADHPEEAAYAYIQSELVPQYGLSEQWLPITPRRYTDTGFYCEELPEEAQGLISALVQDFDGDGDQELVTLRLEGYAYLLDLYTFSDGTYALLDSYPLLTYGEDTSCNPRLWVQDDLLILINYSLECDPAHEEDPAFTEVCAEMFLDSMPDVALVGAQLTAVRITDSGFEERAVIRNTLTPGKEVFSANGEELTSEVGGMDYEQTHTLARKVLDSAGVRYDSDKLCTYWGYLGDELHDGLSLTLTDAEPVFGIDSGNQTIFSDHTDLYAMTASE